LHELVAAKRSALVTPPRELRREIPAELSSAVLACLEPAPAARPTAEALGLRLAAQPTAVLAGDPPRATIVRVGPSRRTFRARRRWPGRVTVAVGVLAVAAVLAGLAASLGGGASPRPHPVRTPAGPTPAEHAHNLARWIRSHMD
jgi:hypothetical protein